MRKILGYALVAVLLGVVTGLAPFAVFISEMDANEMLTRDKQFDSPTPENTRALSAETEQTRGITSATLSPEILFIAFMLALSLTIALGARRHLMRKTIF